MKILVACEESQAVTIELRKLGHDYCISAMHSFSSVRGKVF